MRRQQNEQVTYLATIEEEVAILMDSLRPQVELQSANYVHTRKIAELEDCLHAQMDASRVSQDQLSTQVLRNKELETAIHTLEMEARKAREAAAKDRTIRMEAERKLKEYVDAQKKMAAHFA